MANEPLAVLCHQMVLHYTIRQSLKVEKALVCIHLEHHEIEVSSATSSSLSINRLIRGTRARPRDFVEKLNASCKSTPKTPHSK